MFKESVYFSVADPSLESFLDKGAFDRSLLLNVLFQPKILIPDSFIFTSRGLERHVLESEKRSLFEACIAKGFVLPAFRDRNCSSFSELLGVMRGGKKPESTAIKGILPLADKLAIRLQIAAQSNPSFSPVFWPQHDLGEKFAELVNRHLAHSEPPPIDVNSTVDEDELHSLWKLTERWRIDCIQQALERTQQLAGRGLRRGEIFNAVGKDLGVLTEDNMSEPTDLMALPLESPERKRALQYYCRWICGLYQYNQAVEFGATSSFPGYDPLSGLMNSDVLPLGSPLDSIDLSPTSTIQETVPLPPTRSLEKISPNDLLEVRNEFGPAYFTSLAVWQRQPNEANEKEVRFTLRQYSKEIVKYAAKEQSFSDAILSIVLGARATPTRSLLTAVLALTGAIASTISPLITPFFALGGVGYAVYLIGANRAEGSRIALKAEQQGTLPPEVNFPPSEKNSS